MQIFICGSRNANTKCYFRKVCQICFYASMLLLTFAFIVQFVTSSSDVNFKDLVRVDREYKLCPATLDLSGRHIQILSPQSLGAITCLKTVNLSNIQLTDVQPGVFNGLSKNLEILDMHDNNLTGIIQATSGKLSALLVLRLDHNRITSIDEYSFNDMDMLEMLDLSHNKLYTLPNDLLSGLYGLKILRLHDNDLVHIDPLAIRYLPILDILDLSNNKLSGLSEEMFVYTMSSLLFRNNSLSAIQPTLFANMSNPQLLVLSSNRLKKLPEDGFTSLVKLRSLDVSRNLLESIPARLLDSSPLIRELNIGHNRLTFLPLNWPYLKTLRFEGNPWQCKCLEGILQFVSKHNVTYEKKFYFKGKRPVCIVTDSEVCLHSLDYAMWILFQVYEMEHPRLFAKSHPDY